MATNFMFLRFIFSTGETPVYNSGKDAHNETFTFTNSLVKKNNKNIYHYCNIE